MTDTPTNEQLSKLLGKKPYNLTPATLANKISHGAWLPAKHLTYLSSIIAKKIEQGNARLIISMPTRHGKTELGNIYTSLWALNNHPEWDVISTSYGKDLASDFGRRVRDMIIEDADPNDGDNLLNVKINPNSTNVSRFHTTAGGSMKSVGLGGAVNGRGADLLIIDDYFKNPDEAFSQAHRDSIFEWFTSVGNLRLAPNASIIIIATRWHVDDLSGRLLGLKNSKYEEIRLPVYAEENDPLGRKPGELLWPERYNKERMKEIEDTMSSFLFSAIMQQNPKVSASNTFNRNWIKVIKRLPQDLSFYQLSRSWDLAGTEGGGDWTVGTLMARDTTTNNIYIVDVKRVQKAPGGVERLIEGTMELDTQQVKVVIEQEPGSSGKAVVEGYITRNPSYSVIPVRSTGSKMIRIDPFFAACEHGRVFMLESELWNETLIDELISIPDSAHDDIGDSLSLGYNNFFQKRSRAGVFGSNSPQANNIKSNILKNNVITGLVFGR